MNGEDSSALYPRTANCCDVMWAQLLEKSQWVSQSVCLCVCVWVWRFECVPICVFTCRRSTKTFNNSRGLHRLNLISMLMCLHVVPGCCFLQGSMDYPARGGLTKYRRTGMVVVVVGETWHGLRNSTKPGGDSVLSVQSYL